MRCDDAPEGFLDWLMERYAPPTPAPATGDNALPGLIPADQLPTLESLADRLPQDVFEFLSGVASPADRSHALANATRALYVATAADDGTLRDDVVLSMLAANPTALDVATSHRPRTDDQAQEQAALEYLWQHHCRKQRGKASPATSAEFEAVDAPAISGLEFVNMANAASAPARAWVIDGWLPRRTVTLVGGAGGIGKSLLAEQAAVAVANGDPWLGLATTAGPVIGLFCEDDADELQRRGARIFESAMYDPTEASRDLHLSARVGKPNALISFGLNRIGRGTELFAQLRASCEALRPVLVILDNVAQLFTGAENDRAEVTQFCNLLAGVALEFDCAVLLLGHPAKMQGSEYSGSTAWEAAVRTRLFLERKDDGTLRLVKAKANYAALDEIVLEYREPGVFVQLQPNTDDEPRAVREAMPILLDAVDRFTARQQPASHLATARNYLPRMMKSEGWLGGISDAIATKALSALLEAGALAPNRDLPWKTSSRHQAKGLAQVADRAGQAGVGAAGELRAGRRDA